MAAAPRTAARSLTKSASRAAGGALAALCLLHLALAMAPAGAGSNIVLATYDGSSPDWLIGPWRAFGGGDVPGELYYAGLWTALALWAFVLTRADALPRRLLIGAVLALHLVYALAPPLLSQDVFSYIAYARLDVEHDLNPYSHAPEDIPFDQVFPYAGSKDAVSVYGPAFTLFSYLLAPLGVAGAFWSFKALFALCSLGVVAVVWRTAERLGRDPLVPALVVGLNPLVLVHVVGGAHNEALVVLITMLGVLAMVGGRELAGAAGATLAAGVKGSALLVVPFMVLAGRRPGVAARRAAAAGLAFAGIVLLALAGFGADALDGLGLLSSNQERTSRWSFPYKTAQLLGALLPGDRLDYRDAVRIAYATAFAAVYAWLSWSVWRGRLDWIAAAGWATLAVLIASAWLVPWYALWLLPFAALAEDRRLLWATGALCAWMLPIAVPL